LTATPAAARTFVEAQAVASLTATPAAARTFVEARCFLRAYREQVPCVFVVIPGQAQRVPGMT